MEFIVRGSSLKHFPALMQELGQDPVQLMTESGIDISALQDPDTYISYPRLATLLNLSCMRTQRSDIGALLALRYGLDMLGALGPLLVMQSSLGRALEMIQQNIGFHARGLILQHEHREGEVIVRCRLEFADRVDCTQLVTLSLGALQQVLLQLAGSQQSSRTVELRRGPASAESAYSELFGSSVRYQQGFDRIRFPSWFLRQTIQIEPLVKERMGWLWRHVGPENLPVSIGKQVERAIRASLPTGECNLDQVAMMVDLHPRVLQNRLRDEGKAFRDVLTDVRKELACEHLQFSDRPLSTLALNLGYSETSALSRSFKEWTGLSPQQWKRRNRLAGIR